MTTDDIRSYPISLIKGQVYSGMRTLDDLAELSGFDSSRFVKDSSKDSSRLRLTAAATDAQRAPPIVAPPIVAPPIVAPPPPPSLGITGLGGAPKAVADENCKLSDPNCK